MLLVEILGFDSSEREKGKMCSTWLKVDLYVFDLSVVKLVIKEQLWSRNKKDFDSSEVRLKRF